MALGGRRSRQAHRCVRGRQDDDDALLKQVYDVDPVRCARYGAELKISVFIEGHQTEVVEKILRHCGLWEEQLARGPPPVEMSIEG